MNNEYDDNFDESENNNEEIQLTPLIDADIVAQAIVLAVDCKISKTFVGHDCVRIFVNTFGSTKLAEQFQKLFDETFGDDYHAEPYEDGKDFPPSLN